MVDSGDLSVSPSAALVGGQGPQAVIDDNNALVVIDESPALETRYRGLLFRSELDPDVHWRRAPALVGSSSSGTVQVLQLELRFQATGYEVRALLFNDTKAWISTSWVPLSDAPHPLELDWRAATVPVPTTAALTFWIDGIQQADLTGIDNDTRRIDQVRLGAVSGVENGTRGTSFFDAFESRRSSLHWPMTPLRTTFPGLPSRYRPAACGPQERVYEQSRPVR